MKPEQSPCRGLYFNVSRKRCESETGYLDKATCQPQMAGRSDAGEIMNRESIIRFVELLVSYYLTRLEEVKAQVMCSLGPYIAECSSAPVEAQFCQGYEEACYFVRSASSGRWPCSRRTDLNLPDYNSPCPSSDPGCLRRCPEVTPFSSPADIRSLECPDDHRSNFFACSRNAQNGLPACPEQPGFGYVCDERSALPPCDNRGCREMATKGTCFIGGKDLSSAGLLSGLVCDRNSGALLGLADKTGRVKELVPENYFTLPEVVHNLLLQWRADEAVAVAGMTLNYRNWIPDRRAPNVVEDIGSLR
jgi:hypothetical protein